MTGVMIYHVRMKMDDEFCSYRAVSNILPQRTIIFYPPTPTITRVRIERFQEFERLLICAACESHKHYECMDCRSDHKEYLCHCDCHDENTKPHAEQGTVDAPHG